MVPETGHEPAAGSHSEQSQSVPGRNLKQRMPVRLQRILSPLETLGFSLTGLLVWPGTVAGPHAALGPSAMFVWLPGVMVAILLNLQLKRTGRYWPDMSGGTSNYATRLLEKYPALGIYAASGYFLSWAALIPINAIVLTNLIEAHLEASGIGWPEMPLKVGFTVIAFVVAFSGTRALAILHLFFMIPAIGFLLVFAVGGISWLALSPDSPGFFPHSWPSFSLREWAKWYFIAVYAVYACEGGAAFVADSLPPRAALRCLSLTAGLVPVVYLGGSWVVMRLATQPGMGNNSFLNLVAAATPFWGKSASFQVTLLIAFASLLSCATTVSLCARVLYQLALDGYISPVFAVVSRRGVLGPALSLTLLISLGCLVWGDVFRIILISGTGYLISIMGFHIGLWLRRDRPEVRWPWLSLAFFLVEAAVLVVGGLAWSGRDLLLGLLLPVAILAVDAVFRRVSFAPFKPRWWIRLYQVRPKGNYKDFVVQQVIVLIVLVCGATVVGWSIQAALHHLPSQNTADLLVIVLLTIGFVGVAIACWTSLPQVVSMDEAREAAEQLFVIALDAIVVLDENGTIRQANPAAKRLFGASAGQLAGRHLNQLLPGLGNHPDQWPGRCEQTLNPHGPNPLILEVAISDRFSQNASETHRDLQEYVVILRDMTERVRAREALQKANEQLEIKVEERTSELSQTVEQLQVEINERRRVEENLRAMQKQIVVQEKLASLGSLTAGIAHEIRNPLNFVNNFSELSAELAEELFEEIENQACRLDPETIECIADLLNDLKQNLQKINQHGQRADRIVSSMLLHSRGKSGHWEATDINSLLAEYVNLAYHGMRAKDASFNITIETDCDESIDSVEIVPQDMGRVFLNIINNACYAAHQKKQEMGSEFSPLLSVRTKNQGERVEIRIHDNGSGMTPEVREKIFNPFFTTKPAGEGTGLGLSISHDIVVQQHRGEIAVETEAGSYAEFIIILPKKQARE